MVVGKKFCSERVSSVGWLPAQLSTLVSCVLTACLAVNRVCVSTCAERGGEREEGPLKNRV